MNIHYTAEDLYHDVKWWNEIAGNKVNFEGICAQAKVIKEECDEIMHAVALNDPLELLDGCVDTIVTVFGMMQKLEELGFDVKEAMKRVAENNATKFIDSPEGVIENKSHIEKLQLTVEFNEEHECYVLRDAMNKIRKPVDFTPVVLDDCVPLEYETFPDYCFGKVKKYGI